MKVVLNSDVLYAHFLLEDKLPGHIQTLCEACAERDVPIVVPETTLMEFERSQRQRFVESKRDDLRGAYELLDSYGVAFDQEDPDLLVQLVDLQALMEATGASIEVVSPTCEDFREAHRRTCRHQPPHPPESGSSEMRDVLIWLIALRTARDEGRAILLSRDEVHSGSYGTSEAEEAGLLRFDEVEDVLTALQIETPTGTLIHALLRPVWENLLDAGVPGGSPIELRGIDAPVFVRGAENLKRARAWIRTSGAEEGQELTGRVEFELDKGAVTRVQVSEILVDGEEREAISVPFEEPREIDIDLPAYAERYEALIHKITGRLHGS